MSEYTQKFDKDKEILKDGKKMSMGEIFLELKKLEREDCEKCNGEKQLFVGIALVRCPKCNGVGSFRVKGEGNE